MMGYYMDAEATLQRPPVPVRLARHRRPARLSGLGCCPPGLGLTVQQAGNYGAAGGSTAASILALSPATGPLAPFVAAGAGLAALASAIFKGANPQEGVDSSKIEAGGIAINKLINEITGENLPTNCTPGQCGKQGVAIWSNSKWPDVPYGATGNPNINIDDAISQVQNLVAQIRSQMTLQQSLSNPFFSGPYMIGLLNKIKAARAAANPVSSAVSSILPSSVTSSSLFPLALVGGGIWAAAHFL